MTLDQANAKSSEGGETGDKLTRLIAFYLPQFHPTPENDAWWGRGFTEWTNATKAAPLFPGHYQPHLPTDLGFYDLRLRQTRHDQIDLAKRYGIDGFCYHYYWFSGKRLLHEPLDDMLADPASDMPFCLCWANENWTRRWDAAEHEILIAQKYLPDDDLEFIRGLTPIFRDERYIQLDGAPFLIVYRPQHLPDAKKTAEIWRAHCASVGIPRIHICCAFTHGNWDYWQFGFDSGVEFPPHNMVRPSLANQMNVEDGFKGHIFDAKDVAEDYLKRDYGPQYNGIRAVFPSWDNTARTGLRATVGLNGTPENYEFWLSQAIKRTREDFPGRERFVFINAWNEWAEGCHLEPCGRYGRAFLEATLRAKQGKSSLQSFTHSGVPGTARRTAGTHSRHSVDRAEAADVFSKPSATFASALRRMRKRLSKSLRKRLRGPRRRELDALHLQELELSQALDRHRAEIAAWRHSDWRLRQRYLSLVEASIAGVIDEDAPLPVFGGPRPFDAKVREIGLDWPSKAMTMIGVKRLRNFRDVIEMAIHNKVPGDVIETGVWRGGASILARAVLLAHGVTDRRVIVADSFEGLPRPDADKYPADAESKFHEYADLSVSLETVQNNFRKFDLLDEEVVFLKGWFKDTIPTAPIEKLAVIRLDGDMYESTIVVLDHLYDRLSPGGWVIIDDYEVVPACKAAVTDFLARRQLTPEITAIDGVGVYFQKV